LKSSISEKERNTVHLLALLVAVILLLPVSSGCTKAQSKEKMKGKTMSILQKKPVYTLKVETFGVSHFINVNDCTVIFDVDDEGQSAVVVPINHWMRSGENTISYDLFPPEPGKPFKPGSYVRITLMVHELSDPEKEYTVATLHFSATKDEHQSHTTGSSPSGMYSSLKNFAPDKAGDIEVFDATGAPMPADEDFAGAMTFKRKINIPSSLPLWTFFQSEEMPDHRMNSRSDDEYEAAMAPLFAEYRKVHDALAKKDIDAILPMFEERNRETDMAFYMEPGTTAKRMRESLMSTLTDLKNGNLELLELGPRNVDYHLEDNKKIVSLRRTGLDHAIILNYVNKKKDLGSKSYPMLFRYQNGKYILTR